MPMSEQGTGRDHNPWGYSIWMAGAGIRGGRAVGASDPIGLRAAEGKVHVRDFHATLLHLFGIDHLRLSKTFGGFDIRLTNVGGEEMQGDQPAEPTYDSPRSYCLLAKEELGLAPMPVDQSIKDTGDSYFRLGLVD